MTSNSENYANDIFVSYCHINDDWRRWTQRLFIRPLRTLLGTTNRQITVFLDDSIETGAAWPDELATNLARSRIMVAVLSRAYFQSEWCKMEIGTMLSRMVDLEKQTGTKPNLIIPVAIDDHETFPEPVQSLQCEELMDFANPYLNPNGRKFEKFTEVLRSRVCPRICRSLDEAPVYQTKWKLRAIEDHQKLFLKKVQKQTSVPSMRLNGQ